jgi:hypothetical protein
MAPNISIRTAVSLKALGMNLETAALLDDA